MRLCSVCGIDFACTSSLRRHVLKDYHLHFHTDGPVTPLTETGLQAKLLKFKSQTRNSRQRRRDRQVELDGAGAAATTVVSASAVEGADMSEAPAPFLCARLTRTPAGLETSDEEEFVRGFNWSRFPFDVDSGQEVDATFSALLGESFVMPEIDPPPPPLTEGPPPSPPPLPPPPVEVGVQARPSVRTLSTQVGAYYGGTVSDWPGHSVSHWETRAGSCVLAVEGLAQGSQPEYSTES
jgi:hypothetical protein